MPAAHSYLHSNMSLFKSTQTPQVRQLLPYLHSNMSLFKSAIRFSISQEMRYLHSNMSLFKSNIYIIMDIGKDIYIPICLYLNLF